MKKVFTTAFLFIAIVVCKPNFLNAQVNTQDSLALVDLYNNTDGPHWYSNDNWLTTAPVSTWYGIKVIGNRVSEINLGYKGLRGSIPSSLGNLTGLTILNLTGNSLKGSIPSEIGNLINLTVLNLGNNTGIKNKLTGSIPASIGNLTQLTDLELLDNQLSGTIPNELGNLINLTTLSLSSNQLSGELPLQLSNLTKLSDLYLSRNNLTGNIPPEIGNCTNLQNLYLNNNQFTGNIPFEIGNLIHLHGLVLNDNKLTGSIPSGIGNCGHLQTLYLNNNKLTGSIPSEIGNCGLLRTLYLNNNKLTGSIPSEIGNCIHLQSFYLDNNQLTGNIPPEIGNLTNAFIYLDHNQLSGRIPSSLSKLVYLDLSYNNLSGSIPVHFGKQTSTYVYPTNFIKFDHNQLSGRIPSSLNAVSKRALVNVAYNKFTFSGMGNLATHFKNLIYSPQAKIDIHINNNILSVYAGGTNALAHNTYTWYKNGNLVATITGDSTYQPATDGAYNVIVTNSVATQLTLYSDTINYTAGNNAIASKMNNNSSISIYPNPAKNYATLSFNAEGKYSITVTDVSGKILQTKTGVANKNSNIVQLDISKYANGIYLVTITDEKNKKQTIRLNKE